MCNYKEGLQAHHLFSPLAPYSPYSPCGSLPLVLLLPAPMAAGAFPVSQKKHDHVDDDDDD